MRSKGVVSAFIQFLGPVEIGAILRMLPFPGSHETHFGSTSTVQLL